MKECEYRIGELEINPERLEGNPESPDHKFIVTAEGDIVTIYVANLGVHSEISERFGLQNKLKVGGGDFYLTTHEDGYPPVPHEPRLELRNYSTSFRRIPLEAAKRFGEIMIPVLRDKGVFRKLGLNYKDVTVKTDSIGSRGRIMPEGGNINSFWDSQ